MEGHADVWASVGWRTALSWTQTDAHRLDFLGGSGAEHRNRSLNLAANMKLLKLTVKWMCSKCQHHFRSQRKKKKKQIKEHAGTNLRHFHGLLKIHIFLGYNISSWIIPIKSKTTRTVLTESIKWHAAPRHRAVSTFLWWWDRTSGLKQAGGSGSSAVIYMFLMLSYLLKEQTHVLSRSPWTCGSSEG